MARPWRIQFPGAIYHVTARGNNRQAIFRDDSDRSAFLHLLARAADRFRLHLFAFCLMTNHYHLFLRTAEPNLAAALQWLNAAYSGRFNRRHRRSGHLFQGRYHAVLLADEAHWLHLSIYLHLNPVRAGLVDDPADYEWSSFRDYTRAKSRFAWLRAEEILADYGRSEIAARRCYRREGLNLAGRPANFWEEMRNRLALAAEERLEEWAKKYPPGGEVKAVPAYRRALRPQADWPEERKRVERVFGPATGTKRPGRAGALPRLAAYYHLVEHCGASVKRTADLVGVGPAAVSQGLIRLRKRMETDAGLRKKLAALAK